MVEARCAFLTFARFLTKITSTSLIAQSGSKHFSGRIGNKYFDQKQPVALALAAFSMFGLTILFYTSHVTNSW